MPTDNRITIELSYEEASMCLVDGNSAYKSGYKGAIDDCCASGDNEDACEYIRDTIGVDWCIVAKDANGEYENREATAAEKQEVCEAIYYDSETDFSNEALAETYLIWYAAASAQNED